MTKLTTEDAVAGFAGAVTFSPEAAAAAAKAIGGIAKLHELEPDLAAKAVQAALRKSTGAVVSIDRAGEAARVIRARQATAAAAAPADK